ncbi:MAG: SGNH/GDSL hydrolase family protein [Clostridium sp.]|nr:SGNH/GDSL hydrolase family protein [Clostridium sp.]
MTIRRILLAVLLLTAAFAPTEASEPVEVPARDCVSGTQWDGARVAILGDSMSDPAVGATTLRYYDYLSDLLGIVPLSYAVNGYQWRDLAAKARALKETGGDVDAILIFCGTNDFNASRPLGEFYSETVGEVNADGRIVERKRRTLSTVDSTFCGSINSVMSYLKNEFPTTQIVILTPIHRGYAEFGESNVQPSEEYANALGLYIDDYVGALRRAGEVWSVPVIDLFSESGLCPRLESHDRYIADPATDRLHPNDTGHYRIARTLQYRLLGLPARIGQ